MELNEKLQELRRQKGLTQEELAQALFVSRTAISKWESGRGYPSIDSLKAISRFFSVTIDELLSGDEVIAIAGEEFRLEDARFRMQVFAGLDCSAALLLLLPLFGQMEHGAARAVSLPALTQAQSYLKTAYFVAIITMVLFGVLMFAMQNCAHPLWCRNRLRLSLLLSALGAFLFVLGRQPYAATGVLVFVLIKVILLLKQR